jgi:YmdB-like protein
MFMEPVENPFAPIDHELNALRLGTDVKAIVVDFHSEATGEKQGAGHFCDGRAMLWERDISTCLDTESTSLDSYRCGGIALALRDSD